MKMEITDAIAAADGLEPEDAETVRDLVATWREHYQRNRLRDSYYYGHVMVKDLGISVSPNLAKRLNPKIGWAGKAVDWWSARTQFDGITSDDEQAQATLESVFAANDAKNMLHKAAGSALRHCCSFLAVTADESGRTVISAYPATAASAIWDEAKKRIKAGMVVVESERPRGSKTRYPKHVQVITDTALIEIVKDTGQHWYANYVRHSMGRVPMEPIAYNATLERPFGRSRITRTVMSLVDDAQREQMNMTAAAAFAAAPQKFLLGADKETAKKIAGSPFEAFIGSLFVSTTNKKGQIPQYGQLAQMTMQPHVEYMRSLETQFSEETGVPLSSLDANLANPSSADAIAAAKEDAIVDIQAFIDGCKRSVGNVAVMVLAAENGTDFQTELAAGRTIDVHYRKPDRPSLASQSDAIVKQISAIPWLADTDTALRELGYDDEQIHQLASDRRRSQSQQAVTAAIQSLASQPEDERDDGQAEDGSEEE